MASVPLLPEPDRLDRLVTLLDAASAEGGWHQPHRLVSFEPDPDPRPGDDEVDGIAFGFRMLGAGQHPLDLLLGFVAPPSWSALGVICFGWAAPAGSVDAARHTSTGDRPSRHPERRRVRVTTIVDRHGTERATAALDDGTVVDEPGTGTVTDALRRCLRLPTAPPPVASSELFAAQWLGSIALSERALTWPEVALRHPALLLLAKGGHRPQPEELIGSGRSLHRAMSWEQLRVRAAGGLHDEGLGIAANVASWMDDGMFARWILGGLPPLPTLLHACAAHLSPDVLRRVRRSLRAWNLDPPLSAQVA